MGRSVVDATKSSRMRRIRGESGRLRCALADRVCAVPGFLVVVEFVEALLLGVFWVAALGDFGGVFVVDVFVAGFFAVAAGDCACEESEAEDCADGADFSDVDGD